MSEHTLQTWPHFGPDTYMVLQDMLHHGKLSGVNGEWQRTLEGRFARTVRTHYALSTNGGTNALLAGMYGLRIGPGDDVIVPGLTFSGSAMPALMLGARVVFADVDPLTYNMTPETLEAALRRAHNPKAVVLVHLHGLVADVLSIRALCNRWGVALIEDACQAHGAWVDDDRMVGSIGDFAAFSLNSSKAMPAGDGGLLVTNNADIYERARSFRTFGEDEDEITCELRPYRSSQIGGNFRLPEISAFLAVRSLTALPTVQDRARENGALLTSILDDVPGIVTPETDGRDHTYHKYRIGLPARINPDDVVYELRKSGLPAGRWQTAALCEDAVYGNHPESCVVARFIVRHSVILFDERHPLCAQDRDTVQHYGERMARVLSEIMQTAVQNA